MDLYIGCRLYGTVGKAVQGNEGQTDEGGVTAVLKVHEKIN